MEETNLNENQKSPMPASQEVASIENPKNKHIVRLVLVGLSAILFGYLGTTVFQMYKDKNMIVETPEVPVQQAEAPVNTPVVDEMADWETYRNEKYGFEMKYPPNVIVDEEKTSEDLSVFFRLKGLADNELICSGTHLTININTDGLCGSLAYKGTSSKTNESIYILDKISTTRYDDYFEDKHVQTRLNTITKDENSYFIDYFISPDDYSQLTDNHKLFDQILSTFKFIDVADIQPAPNIRTINHEVIPDWETYNNEFSGLSFQYPPWMSPATEELEWDGETCHISFAHNPGGLIWVKVVPYGGGSRRQLFGVGQPTYTYSYDEAYIQGSKSLLIEVGPRGDSGDGAGAVIPKGKYAVILWMGGRTLEDEFFQGILKSIKISKLTGECG